MGRLLPDEARAAFDVTKSTAGQALVLTRLESVWNSPPGRCDVTFLKFPGPDPVIGQPMEVAAVPPPLTEGAYVYVIGHPAGGGLKFSIRGNDLVAYDSALAKVHYTAPTEGGSSGSPVFNQAWQLMAMHHAGDSKMRRFDDPTNTYQANEGILSRRSERSMRTMGDDTIPAEFLEPEGDGERQDPDLTLEATTSLLREMWNDWMCRKGGGGYADVEFFGRHIGGVPTPATDAYRALEQALRSSGYVPGSCWAYNCRLIAGTDQPSLHSAGIAVDIDPTENPFTDGDPFAGKFRPEHVAAAMAIRNVKGARVWSWGGHWSKPDRMHFQLDQGPTSVTVDWATVPGGKPDDVDGTSQEQQVDIEEDEMTLGKGMKGPAVKRFQECLLAWNPKALPEDGADAIFGSETTVWVRKFQEAFGLEKSGKIDGVTAAILGMHHG